MTAIVGLNFLSEVIVVADTRVSWPGTAIPPRDILQKLYKITSPRSPGKAAVLGFSGDVTTVKRILSQLGVAKLRNYRRRLVMADLKDDLRRWLEQSLSTLDPAERGSVSFMLCGLEPSRPAKIVKGNATFVYPQILEAHIYVYQVTKNTGKVSVARCSDFAVIGTGAKLRDELQNKSFQLIRFGLNQPDVHWARAHLVGVAVNDIIQASSEGSVGGPLQIARLTAEGLRDDYVWPSATYQEAEVKKDGATVILRNPTTNQEYRLHVIWELPG